MIKQTSYQAQKLPVCLLGRIGHMNNFQKISAALGLALLIGTAWAFEACAVVCSPTQYCEVGDAGSDFASAQIVTGGPYAGISATIGEGTDTQDFFLLGWAGGAMQLSVSCPDCGTSVEASAAIYDSFQSLIVSTSYDGEPVNSSMLAAGNYYLKFFVNGVDPPISSAIFQLDPNGGPITTVAPVLAAAVPEPASLALLASGLLGFGLIRRRRMNL